MEFKEELNFEMHSERINSIVIEKKRNKENNLFFESS